VLLQEPGLQPLREHFLVHGNIINQPVMADLIKAGFDIPLQDPARTGRTPEDLVAFIQGIGTAAFQSKAVGMAVGQGLRDGIEAEQIEGLHRSIGHGGDA
jgi:hypothetical protein